MNWKIFITVCVSALFISFPQNIIGCGGEADPYDYFTSFFHPNLTEEKGFRPFYYTSYEFLYDDTEPERVSDILAEEWSNYTSNKATSKDAYQFVNKYGVKDLTTLYFNIEKNKPLAIPDSVKQNSMTKYFIAEKDLEALGYLMYAKKVEPHVAETDDIWSPLSRDSIAMSKLIKDGRQLYAASKKNLFKLKYAYQMLRLAHYSNQFTEAIKIYDNYIAANTEQSILQPLSLALKAGALYRIGDKKQATYLYSKAFASTNAKRISNYKSFSWTVEYNNITHYKEECLALCKNNEEKANMLVMFALNNPSNDLSTIENIYSLSPTNKALETLVTREVNKIEEHYLSGELHKDARKSSYDYYWYNTNDSTNAPYKEEVQPFISFLNKVSQDGNGNNKGLYLVAAAYLSYVGKDLVNADKYLTAAKKLTLTQKVNDQWYLTNLLVTISKQNKIDADFERQLLPSIKWLEQKAKADTPFANSSNYFKPMIWTKFYRDFFTEVLAPLYRKQGDNYKEALAIGTAEAINIPNVDRYSSEWSSGASYLRNYMTSKDVEKLFALQQSKSRNTFEDYLVTHNTIKKKNVIDFAGTAYLRDYDFDNAITWFKKEAGNKEIKITTNPFIELLYDREEALPSEKKFSTTKLAFAKEMKRLLQLTQTDKANAAKYFYKMALGMYNITYYGHAWKLVQYDRSGSDGYYIPDNASSFQKEYYGCFSAHEYFEKAMKAATDNNFKARCLFMMAKCTQKQLHQPQYSEYENNWNEMDKAQEKYQETFKNNRYFPTFVKDYQNTPFYKEAFNSCSYLRDFVGRK